eukprot:Seg4962.1 transcript_id=Seg4962.1/GoldUCD/mRNA.D3Y31 product="EF-hand calcium-binding domain-containing protein 11" protein_id=Seg4962.1/GoldUCD/D3Y31
MYTFLQSRRSEIRNEDYKIIKQSFNFADAQNKNYLTRREFKVGFVTVFGHKPSKFDVDEIMMKYGKKKLECTFEFDVCSDEIGFDEIIIDFNDFKNCMQERLKLCDIDDEIRETFQIMDAKCKGFIDFTDFKKMVDRFLPSLDQLNMQRMFNEADRDGDGRVSYRDFQLLMKHDS